MKKHTVLYCSDPAYPLSNTGFGIVGGKLLEGLIGSGKFDVAHLARGVNDTKKFQPPYRVYVPPQGDPNGYGYIVHVIKEETANFARPELIIIEADPGSVLEWTRQPETHTIPALVHCPVEGEPMLDPWATGMAEVVTRRGRITCYTQYSKKVIDDAIEPILAHFSKYPTTEGESMSVRFPDTEVLPLGVDHADWGVDAGLRKDTRERYDWADKFVVMNVARNTGRKNWPTLFEAIKLAHEKHPEVILYAHTVPFENYFLGGHDMFELRRYYGLENIVYFKKGMVDPYFGISQDGGGNGDSRDATVSLKAIYNAADLFIAPTGGEGCNLPAMEAAACGLPVVTTEYAGGWEMAKNFAYPLNPTGFSTHPNGVRFANICPQDIANFIEQAITRTGYTGRAAKDGLISAYNFKWKPTVDRFVDIALEMCENK